MTRLQGGCHCGNLVVRFSSSQSVGALQLRACQCSFCRKHGVRTVTDPDGELVIQIRDPEMVTRHTFGLGVSEFLVCRTCGVYVAAVLERGDRCVATLNVNVLDDTPFNDRIPEPVSYSSEDFDARQTRRLRQWTPALIRHDG